MVPEDPAAVAARAEQRKKNERTLVIVLGIGMAVGGAVVARNFIRDTREAVDLARRPRQPWDV